MAKGKFQGVMSPATPRGRRRLISSVRMSDGGAAGMRVAVGVERGLRLVAQDPDGAGVLARRLDARLADLADHQVDELVLGGVDGGGGRVQRVRPGERVARPLALRGARLRERRGHDLAVRGRRGDDDVRLVLR